MTCFLRYTNCSLRLIYLLCGDVVLLQQRRNAIQIVLRIFQLCICRNLRSACVFHSSLCCQHGAFCC